jgi:hypothetical protein
MSKTQKLKAQIKAIEERCKNDENYTVAAQMFKDLYDVAEKTVLRLMKEATIEPDTEVHLRTHYLKQFYFALAVKRLHYDEAAKADLLWLAAVLGGRLVHHAQVRGETDSRVLRIDAQLASFDVDCPPGRVPLDWCN